MPKLEDIVPCLELRLKDPMLSYLQREV